MKHTLTAFGISLLLLSTPAVAFAQTATPSATPEMQTSQSDFAKDVGDGEKEVANDQTAQENQKGVQQNETIEVGEQEHERSGDEDIDQQEKTDLQESGD